MNSISFLRNYIIFLNILIVCSQQQQQQLPQHGNKGNLSQQQGLNVHQSASQSLQQQQQEQLNNNNEQLIVRNPENGLSQQAVPVVGLFSSSYRGQPHSSTSNNSPVSQQPAGQFITAQQGFATYPAYAQHDGLQFATTSVQQQPPQLFGLSSNGDFTLSAYFGPMFWLAVSSIIVIILIILIIKVSGGFERIGGFVEKLSDPNSKNGRAIDLDKLSTMVYTAFDQYGKWKNHSSNKKL